MLMMLIPIGKKNYSSHGGKKRNEVMQFRLELALIYCCIDRTIPDEPFSVNS
jgi:hypothetical protein